MVIIQCLPLMRQMAYYALQNIPTEASKILQNITANLEIHFGVSHSNNAYIFDQIASYFEENRVYHLALEFLLPANKMYESLVGKANMARVDVNDSK